jgi:hypothetical protein
MNTRSFEIQIHKHWTGHETGARVLAKIIGITYVSDIREGGT